MDETRGRPTLTHRNLARRLLQWEINGADRTVPLVEAAEVTSEHLRSVFSPVMTRTGINALMSRALYLSRPDFPLLARVSVGRPGEPCFVGLREDFQHADPAESEESLLALLATTIALLSIFIGEEMVARKLESALAAVPAGKKSQKPG